MDTVSSSVRSKIMASVKQKSTKPEVILRKSLHKLGLRYVLNDKRLPGSPDLVFPKYGAVVFINGCFWHRHGCKFSTMPKTRKLFWEEKFKDNIKRDKRNIKKLRKLNWRVKVVWECQLKGNNNKAFRKAEMVSKWLKNGFQNDI